jgi:hypothetical protein
LDAIFELSSPLPGGREQGGCITKGRLMDHIYSLIERINMDNP